MNRKQKKSLIRIIIATVLTIVIKVIFEALGEQLAREAGDSARRIAEPVLYLIPYLVVGYESIKKAVKGIIKGRVFDENFLMTVATFGAFVTAIVKQNGEFGEAVAVMLFYRIGELFESYAVGKSRKNISALMDIRPDSANLIEGDEIRTVSPEEVKASSLILVKPGERVPLDGVVVEGVGTLDAAALTGESKPLKVNVGDNIISGCINLESVLRIRTTREFGESTVSKILELVENASSRKSRSENFISKFAKYYTPIVCCAALALAIVAPLFSKFVLGLEADFSEWIYRALTFLVISCPCALVISIPLGFFAGIGGASRAGVLVKGSNYLESLSQVDTIVFDKTGTLTKGVFEVVAVHHSPVAQEELLRLAAHAESMSVHPIGKSILKAYAKEIDSLIVRDIHEISGEGVTAFVDDMRVLAGNEKLMRRERIEYCPCHDEGTIVHVAVDGQYFGHILIADVLKDEAKSAIDELRRLGIENTVMLTGDSTSVAAAVANRLGIRQYFAQLLPQDKVTRVEELLKDSEGKLAFVGDGINDAPVLTRADVGIAMGSMGSDAAIEAADIVLMDDNPMGIVRAIGISRKCMRIVYENIWFAIGIKIVCLILGAVGIASMWLAIFADVGVMVIAVLNAIRSLKVTV